MRSRKGYANDLLLTHNNAWLEGRKSAHKDTREMISLMAKEIWLMAEAVREEAEQVDEQRTLSLVRDESGLP